MGVFFWFEQANQAPFPAPRALSLLETLLPNQNHGLPRLDALNDENERLKASDIAVC
jgi:hypothetical protein